jgi:hypothetical protein
MKVGTKLWRFGVLAAAVTAAAMAVGVVSEAASTITAPNSSVVSFSLTAGGTSAGFTPPTGSGVLLLAMDTTTANFGVGNISLAHITGTEIRWVGQESSTGAITHGGTTAPGTHVVYLDASHKVDLEILSADSLVIHNGMTTTQAGKVTMIW